MKNRILIIFSMLLSMSIFTSVFSQCVVSGKVIDKTTKEPLYFAEVFLSNTTLGNATDKEGNFRIKDISPGVYQLVARFIGYELLTQPIELKNSDNLSLTFELSQKPINLQSVSVEATRPKEWKRILKKFLKEFFGETEYAAGCKILNPEVLDFKVDNDMNGYIATTDSTVFIENKFLGYKIYMNLDYFKWGIVNEEPDYEKDLHLQPLFFWYVKNSSVMNVPIFGHRFYLLFEEMKSKNNKEIERWENNRKKLYSVSLKHFLSTLASGKSDKEYSLFHYPIRSSVSGNHYNVLDSKEGKKTDFSKLNVTILDHGLREFYLEDFLKIYYGTGYDSKASYLQLKGGKAVIDTLGNIYDSEGITISGYWSKLRVAGLLPTDYHPSRTN